VIKKNMLLKYLKIFSFFEFAIFLYVCLSLIPYNIRGFNYFPPNKYNSLCSLLNMNVMIITLISFFFVMLDMGLKKVKNSYSIFINRKQYLLSQSRQRKKVFVGRMGFKIIIFLVGVVLLVIIQNKIKNIENLYIEKNIFFNITNFPKKWYMHSKEKLLFCGTVVYITLIIDIIIDLYLFFAVPRQK